MPYLIKEKPNLVSTKAEREYSIPELDYHNVLEDIYKFRDFHAISTSNDLGYNSRPHDEPNYYLFKLFFYFNKADSIQSGLLGLQYSDSNKDKATAGVVSTVQGSEDKMSKDNKRTYSLSNTAYNFLLNNAEYERADLLVNFINMLQDINCNYPWYFQKIEGLNAIMERNYFTTGELKIEDEVPAITITCLPDSKDDKIGTLIDLYKAVCFSEVNKKEIVPANLRKFDMGVMVFSVPCRYYNSLPINDKGKLVRSICSGRPSLDKYDTDSVKYVSTKYYELHNCEIKYKSGSKLVESLNNGEEIPSVEYAIEIAVESVKENRWNEFLCKNIGDFIETDLDPTKDSVQQEYNSDYVTKETYANGRAYSLEPDSYGRIGLAMSPSGKDVIEGKENLYGLKKKSPASGYLSQSLDVLGGHLVADIKKNVKDLALGNIYKTNDIGSVFQGAKDLVQTHNLLDSAQVVGSFIKKKEKPLTLDNENIYKNGNNSNVQVYKIGAGENIYRD